MAKRRALFDGAAPLGGLPSQPSTPMTPGARPADAALDPDQAEAQANAAPVWRPPAVMDEELWQLMQQLMGGASGQ